MAWRAERHRAVEIEVRAPLGALDDVVDLEGAPAPTGLAPPAGAEGRQEDVSRGLEGAEALSAHRAAAEVGVVARRAR
jgi:hypothetical protein